jgi:hypothetical protein
VLHRGLAQAARWDWIWLNPASNATPPAGGRPPGVGEARGPAALLLPQAGGLDRRSSQPAPGLAVGRRRRRADRRCGPAGLQRHDLAATTDLASRVNEIAGIPDWRSASLRRTSSVWNPCSVGENAL